MAIKDDERMAEAGYEAYSAHLNEVRGGMKRPVWKNLPATVRIAWVNAVLAVMSSRVDVESMSDMMRIAGHKGGKIGGKQRAKALSPQRRSEIASKAARKRWHPEINPEQTKQLGSGPIPSGQSSETER